MYTKVALKFLKVWILCLAWVLESSLVFAAESPSSTSPTAVSPSTQVDSVDSVTTKLDEFNESRNLQKTSQQADSIETTLPKRRQGLHPWYRYIRGFRRHHNFAYTLGATAGHWKIMRFGTLGVNELSSNGLYGLFQYSFHLPIRLGFGYYLGSSVGYQYEGAHSNQAFHPTSAVMFPSLTAGIVANISPVVRFSVGLDSQLTRYDGLSENDETLPNPKVSVTMRAADLGAYLDIFLNLKWGLRLELRARQTKFNRPLSSEGTAVDVSLEKTDTWFGLGLIHHLL